MHITHLVLTRLGVKIINLTSRVERMCELSFHYETAVLSPPKFFGGDKRQPEIRLRSQASDVSDLFSISVDYICFILNCTFKRYSAFDTPLNTSYIVGCILKHNFIRFSPFCKLL